MGKARASTYRAETVGNLELPRHGGLSAKLVHVIQYIGVHARWNWRVKRREIMSGRNGDMFEVS